MDTLSHHKIWSQLDLGIWFKIAEQTVIPVRRRWEQSNNFPIFLRGAARQTLTIQIQLDMRRKIND